MAVAKKAKKQALTGTFSNTTVGSYRRNRRGVEEFVPTLDENEQPIPSALGIRVDCELGTEFPADLSSTRIKDVNKQYAKLNLPALKFVEGVNYVLSRVLEFKASVDKDTGRTMPAIARAFYRAPRPTVTV
ncbi:MAG: hypothetical protein QGH83_01160 [Candidatus Pacebacteria bacterium]|nr:hypothetical protein [Candidatus Paceibacterota bacterium]